MEKIELEKRRPSKATVQLIPLANRADSHKPGKTRHIFLTPRFDATQLSNRVTQSPKPLLTVKRHSVDRSLSLRELGKSLIVPRFRDRIGSVSHLPLSSMLPHEEKSHLTERIGGRINGCYSQSQVGTVNRKPKPQNQDTVFYFHGLCPEAEFSVLGVCDGHGVAGHLASGYIAQHLPAIIKENCLRKAGKVVDFWSAVLVDSYTRCNAELLSQDFDTSTSGSTCVSVVLSAQQLICANVGDSRALLARRSGTALLPIPLSKDHKPDVPEEKARIVDFGGRVGPMLDEENQGVGPARVWFKTEDAPGLAMSRSLGDSMAARLGVIALPGKGYLELMSVYLSPEDAFVVVASDGVWEFMSNEEVVGIVAASLAVGEKERCCERLIAEASTRWDREEGGKDDITALVAFLE